jgi:hypothetical protein
VLSYIGSFAENKKCRYILLEFDETTRVYAYNCIMASFNGTTEILQRILQYEERTTNQPMDLDHQASSEALESQLDTLIAQYEARILKREHEVEKVSLCGTLSIQSTHVRKGQG